MTEAEKELFKKYQNGQIGSAEEWREVGELLFKTGDWLRALEIYERLGEQIPVPTLLRIAKHTSGRNDFETAERAYRLAVNQEPQGTDKDQVRQGLQWLKDRTRLTGIGRDYADRADCLLHELG